MKRQPIAQFRKLAEHIRKSFIRFSTPLRNDLAPKDSLIEFFKMHTFSTKDNGNWHVKLDITDDTSFRSIWIHSRFDRKNELTGGGNPKWNHCLFQSTSGEPLTSDQADYINAQIVQLFRKAGVNIPKPSIPDYQTYEDSLAR